MTSTQCEQLEAFLDGELEGPSEVAFVAHLDMCAECRAIVEQQSWVERLLRDASEATVAPHQVQLAVEHQIGRARRNSRLAYGFATLAAAASLLLALGLWVDPAPKPTPRLATDQLPTITPVATFTGTDEMIVVEHESSYPDVTIVQVYPTITGNSP